MAHPQEGRQLLLKGLAFCAKGEPEIEGAAHGRLHFLLGEHPARVGDGGARLPGLALRIRCRPEAAVHLAGVLAGEAQDFLPQCFGVGHAERGIRRGQVEEVWRSRLARRFWLSSCTSAPNRQLGLHWISQQACHTGGITDV